MSNEPVDVGKLVTQMSEELECPICCETLTQAVTIKCNHRFCKGCLQKHHGSESRRECPLCKGPYNLNDIKDDHCTKSFVGFMNEMKKYSKADQKQQGAACVSCGKMMIPDNDASTRCSLCTTKSILADRLISKMDTVKKIDCAVAEMPSSMNKLSIDIDNVTESMHTLTTVCIAQLESTRDRLLTRLNNMKMEANSNLKQMEEKRSLILGQQDTQIALLESIYQINTADAIQPWLDQLILSDSADGNYRNSLAKHAELEKSVSQMKIRFKTLINHFSKDLEDIVEAPDQ